MKKVVYNVSQLSLSGRGKKMWKHGDVVTENDFPENFNQLIKEGRIKSDEVESEDDDDDDDLFHTLTEADFEENPCLEEAGLKVGELIELSEMNGLIEDCNKEAKAVLLEQRKELILPYTEVITEEQAKIDLSELSEDGFLALESFLKSEYNQLVEERMEDEAKKAAAATPLFTFVDSENNQRPIFTVKDITKAELQAYLLALEIAFKPSEKEEVLFEKAVQASKKAE